MDVLVDEAMMVNWLLDYALSKKTMSAHKIRSAPQPFLIIVRGRTLVLRANAKKDFPDQLSTAVASTLRLPAIFLGGKTCCAFDCSP